jgi:hypothetical protein
MGTGEIFLPENIVSFQILIGKLNLLITVKIDTTKEERELPVRGMLLEIFFCGNFSTHYNTVVVVYPELVRNPG